MSWMYLLFRKFCIATLSLGITISTGCDWWSSPQSDTATHLTIWVHSGRAQERDVVRLLVRQFEQAHQELKIDLVELPEGNYNSQVLAAAMAGELPDILEFDGPFLYRYVWLNQLIPLDDLIPETILNDLLPSILDQGTYQNKLYAIGAFESGLAIWANKALLRELNIRIPSTVSDAWTVEEFEKILYKLRSKDKDGAVLDLKLNYSGEWFSYAFAPVLQSAGADLVDRRHYRTATGILDSAPAIRSMQHIKDWITAGLVDQNLDDAAFTSRRVALSWVGHWEYPRYKAALGKDLILVPLPNFGIGPRSSQGSWVWSITQNCKDPKTASQFLQFLLAPPQITRMVEANGAIPASQSVVKTSDWYQVQGPLRLYVELLQGNYSTPRPKTPAYPFISTLFQQAFNDIRNGADVKRTLQRNAQKIDQYILDNRAFP